MFTGIVAGLGEVVRCDARDGLTRFGVRIDEAIGSGIARGASVSIDGVCLTALEREGDVIFFQAMGETLTRTTLGALAEGRRVNVERSVRVGDEVGGHTVSGHVDGVAEISAIDRPPNNCVMTFRTPPALMKFIFSKGFIALDGASLTVVNADQHASTFQVWFIPETLRVTTFANKSVGDFVNLEVDPHTRAIVETVERLKL